MDSKKAQFHLRSVQAAAIKALKSKEQRKKQKKGKLVRELIPY